ncbi:hypothetical protein HPB51_014605 [Rhipicephalus microplus]|uniref:Uncharacterized protein n=1 Tax=Rhipicephalus microplus TaxID=6941 RepID=A0A9J6F427_RHIMP|nr:hypothetical protein HPB51_014605 [Rhipicephalus microplus]
MSDAYGTRGYNSFHISREAIARAAVAVVPHLRAVVRCCGGFARGNTPRRLPASTRIHAECGHPAGECCADTAAPTGGCSSPYAADYTSPGADFDRQRPDCVPDHPCARANVTGRCYPTGKHAGFRAAARRCTSCPAARTDATADGPACLPAHCTDLRLSRGLAFLLLLSPHFWLGGGGGAQLTAQGQLQPIQVTATPANPQQATRPQQQQQTAATPTSWSGATQMVMTSTGETITTAPQMTATVQSASSAQAQQQQAQQNAAVAAQVQVRHMLPPLCTLPSLGGCTLPASLAMAMPNLV